MFEIGKTYSIKNIDVPCDGAITILNKVDEQGTTWDCRLKLSVSPFNFGFSQVDNNFSGTAFLFQRYGDYWETDEGYLELWFTRETGKPTISIYRQADYVDDILIAEWVTMKFVDNLDLVVKLDEKRN